jgi:hypothetical protein
MSMAPMAAAQKAHSVSDVWLLKTAEETAGDRPNGTARFRYAPLDDNDADTRRADKALALIASAKIRGVSLLLTRNANREPRG